MTAKKNCWDVMSCGRQPGGSKSSELGVCVAAMEQRLDGAHGGKNGGRACWVVAGTFCGGKVQGSFAAKAITCMKCAFYTQVFEEEQEKFMLSSKLSARLA